MIIISCNDHDLVETTVNWSCPLRDCQKLDIASKRGPNLDVKNVIYKFEERINEKENYFFERNYILPWIQVSAYRANLENCLGTASQLDSLANED